MELSIQFKFSFSCIKQHKKSYISYGGRHDLSHNNKIFQILLVLPKFLLRLAHLCCCWRCPRSSGDCPGKMKGKIPWRWSDSEGCCFLSPKSRIEENCPAQKKCLFKLILNSGPWRKRSGRLFMLKMKLHLLSNKPCCKPFIWLESSGLIEQVSLGNFLSCQTLFVKVFTQHHIYIVDELKLFTKGSG